MAAKLPTSISKESLGSLTLLIAKFDGTVSSNDLDNADTWSTGVTTIVGDPWFAGAVFVGLSVDPVTGIITATTAGTATGHVYVLCKA
jgi:hypothetical protein